MIRRFSLFVILPTLVVTGFCLQPMLAQQSENNAKPRKVFKTDDQWLRLLTPEQFLVTRRKATEPAFTGKYATSHGKGTYICVCCGAPLFSSQHKFDSGTGWPSFWQPVEPKRLEMAPDFHQAEPRTEVMCIDCGAHLGHVFNDGPLPTGLRFCINSAALKLVSKNVNTAATTSKKTAKGKSKSKTHKSDSEQAESASLSTEDPKATTPDSKANTTEDKPAAKEETSGEPKGN